MHLFVDISSHGFGHLAIAAPVLNALGRRLPELRLTIRTLLPEAQLRRRIASPFTHIHQASDFGFVMHDAIRVDRDKSEAAYRLAHADWPASVATEAAFLKQLSPDLVLSNVSYLPLAGAARAGLPAAALCSLNWADIFQHHFADDDWAAPIHRQILDAYRSARAFLRITPGMPMPDLDNLVPIGVVAQAGTKRPLGLPPDMRVVLVGMGGIKMRLPLENWPRLPGVRWLVPDEWQCRHPDALPQSAFRLSFTDLLASVDAVLSKPGYGTFSEAVASGTPVLYQRRQGWPEEDCLIEWLHAHGRAREIDADTLMTGDLQGPLTELLALPAQPPLVADGADEAAKRLLNLLRPLP